ncbi:MAG: AMP-binding protein [Betaproteobacteria bacterium]|nr:AMP-binding protein [Betaproteobacteria bacterium]
MEFYDRLETRDPEQREREQFAALAGQIAHAQKSAPYFGKTLAGVSPADITDRAALAKLPVTRKSDFTELQQAHLPFGQMVTLPVGRLARVFMSPGPIFDPEGRRADYWRFGRAMFAAGFRKGELVYNTFSYHMTPAGFMADLGAQAIGCAVFPGGTGQTEKQVAAIAALRPECYVGTPSFLRIMLEKGAEMEADLSSLKKALVSAEALPASLRVWFSERAVKTLQCYAIGDLGMLAYESPALEGMIVDEGIIIEIVRPGTGEPVTDGEVGEVLVTSLAPEYPLIRFATGDLSAVLSGASPCGRTNLRIKGWMGRADQTTKVKGMFVKPSQLAEVAKRHPEIRKYRLIVEHDDKKNDRMTFACEVDGADTGALADAIAGSIRAVCNLRGEIALEPRGSLANDGKVIEDLRKYD